MRRNGDFMKRESGVLMHISSLYGDYSIGTFGKNAFEFIDFLKDNGFSVWQVLPFTVTDEYNSPYKSFSAFGGNPYFIDPEKLYEDGLISKEDLDGCRQEAPYSCEFKRLGKERMALLKKSKNALPNNFIEGMACVGGCIGGAGCLTHGERNKIDVEKHGKQSKTQDIKTAVNEYEKSIKK